MQPEKLERTAPAMRRTGFVYQVAGMGESGQTAAIPEAGSHSESGGEKSLATPEKSQEPLCRELAFLSEEGIARSDLEAAQQLSDAIGRPPEFALIALGIMDRDGYDRALSRRIGASWAATIEDDGENKPMPQRPGTLGRLQAFPLLGSNGPVRRLYVTASETGAGRLLDMARLHPGRMAFLTLVPSLVLRKAHGSRAESTLIDLASSLLDRRWPGMSARDRLSARQISVFCAALPVMVPALIVDARLTLVTMAILMTAYFLRGMGLRLSFLFHPQDDAKGPKPARSVTSPHLPIYTILVALYREANQIRPLVASLEALEWPKDRLEIFIICEANDLETIGAVEALQLSAPFCLVKVPDALPKTKPKALNFTLPLAGGEFLVVYDAEDRPHRKQLMEAFSAFERHGPLTACLQAPLAIRNRRQNWLTAMFALEYDTLFRGMLPQLARMGGPLPLGGTSNHFRLECLRDVGGWDAWNVAEDADLGIRLGRIGYRCGTIRLPTSEEAPPRLGTWLRQRTRWFKGWIQTLTVHSREPRRTRRELGRRGFRNLYLFLGTTVLSALIHPFAIVAAAYGSWKLATGREFSIADVAMTTLALANFVAGYSTYIALSLETKIRHRLETPLWLYLTLPAYWLLMSVAAWRALWQFFVAPFQWEKTSHGPSHGEVDALEPDSTYMHPLTTPSRLS